MKIAQEEIFGPVLAALAFDDVEQVAELANRNPTAWRRRSGRATSRRRTRYRGG